MIGFAADGFPIYGPFIDDNGDFRSVTSSYVLRSGADKANREKELSLVGIVMALTWTTMNTRKVVEIWTNVTAG